MSEPTTQEIVELNQWYTTTRKVWSRLKRAIDLRALCADLCNLGQTLREQTNDLIDQSFAGADRTATEDARETTISDVLDKIDEIRTHLSKEQP